MRTARTASITLRISSASCGKHSSSRYCGHRATMMDSPSCGRACQISSVMNGMNGWSRRMVEDITHASTRRAFWAASSSPEFSRIFEISIYQSQNSSHRKS